MRYFIAGKDTEIIGEKILNQHMTSESFQLSVI